MKISNEIKVGIIVLVALAALAWGYSFLKDQPLMNARKGYYVVYPKIEGLALSNPVQVNGFTVGKVDEIYFHPNNSGNIIVHLSISEETIALPKGTVAKITSLDLLGAKAIALSLGESIAVMHQPGDTLAAAVQLDLQESVTAEVLPLKLAAEELIGELDSAIKIVQLILNRDARDNLSKTFTSLSKTFKTLEHVANNADTMIAENRYKLTATLTNLQNLTATFSNNRKNIENILTNFSSFSDSIATVDIATTLKGADRALADFSVALEKVNRGEGTIGKLMQDDSLYMHLDKTVVDLDRILVDLESHPGKYITVFGKSTHDRRIEKEYKRERRRLIPAIKNAERQLERLIDSNNSSEEKEQLEQEIRINKKRLKYLESHI